MDVGNDEEMETGWSSKRLTLSDHDFLSDLPDPILVHILSFLPIGDAVKTVLLRRFGNLWRSIPVLHLNECLYHDCMDKEDFVANEIFTGIIHHISNLHDTIVLDRLHLSFCFGGLSNSENTERDKDTAGDLDKLIAYAINRKVKVLVLNFAGCTTGEPPEFYELPDVFRSNYITDLKLHVCDMKLCANINLKALRVLLLHRINSLNDKVMENILLGSPYLEDLSVFNCYGLGRLYCENQNLKMLRVDLEEPTHFELYCPYVLSLEIDGWTEQATLLSASSLINASIFYDNFRCEDKAYVDVVRFLQEVCQCTTFSSDCCIIMVMTIWTLRNMPCSSFKWKNLMLNLGMQKWYYPGVSWLLRSSHSIETLTMYIFPGRHVYFEREASKWIWAYDFDETNYWDLQGASFPYLESITIEGCINEPFVIQMVKFLLRSATKLKKIVLLPTEWEKKNNLFTSEQHIELEQKLLLFPRASSQAVIYFS